MTNALVVTHRFYPPWSDGTVSYARGLVDAMSETARRKKNLEITVLSLTDKTWFPKIHHREMKEYFGKKQVSLEWFFAFEREQQITVWRLLKKLSQKKDYELIHVVYLGFNPLLARFGVDGRHKSVIVKHLFVFPFHSSFIAEKFVYNFFGKTDVYKKLNVKLVFSSEVLQKLYNTEDVAILPPAIDTNFYSVQHSPFETCEALTNTPIKFGNVNNVLQRDVVALYMGPLTNERFDYKSIIGGFAKLCEDYGVNAGLVIVGRGFEDLSFLEKIKNLAHRRDLTDRIFICLKDLSEAEKVCLFNHVDVFVYPFSGRLGHMSVVFPPIALLESMSAGLCVVSGGIPFLNSIIKNGENGVLFEEDANDRVLAKGMWLALTNKRKISQKARLTIKKKFSIEHVSAMYVDFLSKIGI